MNLERLGHNYTEDNQLIQQIRYAKKFFCAKVSSRSKKIGAFFFCGTNTCFELGLFRKGSFLGKNGMLLSYFLSNVYSVTQPFWLTMHFKV